MSELRPYQVTAIDSALAALSNSGSAVLQMPTGAGKTRAVTEIVTKGAEGPVWFVCHRQEIERQAAKAFTAAGIDFGIVSPRGVPEYDKPVQIVSVATLARRIKELPAPKLVAWDECHHIPAKSWAAIREQLTDAKHLGLTATPERLDGKGLSEWFSELITGPTTRELIDAGYLSDFRYFAPSDPDLSAAKMQAGDYRKADLAKVMNTPVLIGDAVAEYRKATEGRRALAFCASVEASRALVGRFNAEGVPALHVDGTTPATERDDAVEALASGSIKVLSNVEVFTEGFDLPAIDVVILLRPTKSLALFLQMVGRVLRRAEGKSEALIFDHAGLWLDHGWFDLPITWSLDGGARKRRLAGRTHGPRRCPECKEVRVERGLVCDCGYEFPTGREIGEYDGVLTEVAEEVPDGHDTQSAFSTRTGIPITSIIRFREEGLPNKKTSRMVTIPIIDGLTWLVRNKSNFRRRATINNYRGVPIKTDGWVTVAEAAEMAGGRTSSIIYLWIRRGELKCINGRVDPTEAVLLAKQKAPGKPKIKKPEGYETYSEFAARYDRDASFTRSLVLRGLPASGNLVEVVPALAWVESNVKFRAAVKGGAVTQADLGSEFENTASFARRIGKSGPTVTYWRRRGFPFHPEQKTMVHIQRGLEWVRDNTNVLIPPEAWPSANDNASAAYSAAG